MVGDRRQPALSHLVAAWPVCGIDKAASAHDDRCVGKQVGQKIPLQAHSLSHSADSVVLLEHEGFVHLDWNCTGPGRLLR